MKTNTIDFTEINKLDEMLYQADLPHTFLPCWDGFQIKLYADDMKTIYLDDAVIHSGSHGQKMGLLETYHLNDCSGYETAEEVFKGWVRLHKKANKRG
jgi:hypothetical protein